MNTGRHSSRRLALIAAFCFALAIFALHVAVLSGFTSDDSFISFRYARNIAAGLGPVFNPGERIEGFSNPLYTFLLAGLHRVVSGAVAFPLAARAIGVLSGAGSLWLLTRLPAAGGIWSAALALTLTATSTSFALWSVGGLETSLYGLLILAGVVVTLARPRRAREQFGLGLVMAAIALSRPEGALPAATLWLARWLDPETRRDFRGHARVLLAALLPVAIYVGWRHAYYGEWLPNTWLAKRMLPDIALRLGVRYLGEFFASNGTVLLYLPALTALWPPRRHRAALLALAVAGIDLAPVLVTGGDWMDAHRFVAPVAPLIYFAVAEGWMTLLGGAGAWLTRRGATAFAALLPAVGALALWGALLVPSVAVTRHVHDAPYVNADPYYSTMGRLLNAVGDPGWSVATDDIGAIGWYGRLRVIDMLGLVNRELAMRRTDVQHLVADNYPELIVLHYDDRTPPRSRWRTLKIRDFDSLYVVPRGPVPVPGSLRVRHDVCAAVEARLAVLDPKLSADLLALAIHLRAHQPDMRLIVATEGP